MAIVSNDEVNQLEIYAGIGAAAGAVGLAYGYDIYDKDSIANRKEQARVDKKQAALDNATEVTESRRQRKAKEKAESRLKEKADRGTRSDYRVQDEDKAYNEAASINTDMDNRSLWGNRVDNMDEAHRQALDQAEHKKRIRNIVNKDKRKANKEGRSFKYNTLPDLGNDIHDTIESNPKRSTIEMNSPHTPEYKFTNPVPDNVPVSPTKRKAASNAYKKVMQTASKVL